MKPINLGVVLMTALFIELLRKLLFPEWIIADSIIRMIDIIVLHLFIAWLISAFLATMFKSWQVFFIAGFWMTVFSGFLAWIYLTPLDGMSLPRNIGVLEQKGNIKVIVTECVNFKHNEVIRDTITVEERFGFRKIIIDTVGH